MNPKTLKQWVFLGTLLVLCCVAVLAADRRQRSLVDTSSGWIMGKKTMLDGVPVFTYLGVPYGEPPVGPRRFRPPVPKSRMDKVFNATAFGPICPQNTSSLDFPFKNPNHNMTEDCLTINVYVPLYASKSRPVAVMVWIHGGGYYSGSGNLYNASILTAVGEVIVVTVNYRLGALGFLSTEDDNAVGNYGLWDQYLALEWIQQNIYEFGGDPNRVTLFGQSSGGATVQLHAMSPVSQKTFHRIIAQSGSALAPWAIHTDPLDHARKLASKLGCRTPSNNDLHNNKVLLACLKKKSFRDIVANQDIGEPGPMFQLAWGPVVDGNFLPYSPNTFLSKVDSPAYLSLAEKDVLAGVNSQDGAVLFQFVVTPHLQSLGLDPTENGVSEHVYDKKLISPIVEKSFAGYDDNVKKAILHQYTNWKEPQNDNERVKSLIEFLSDQHFIAGSVLFAKEHLNASRSVGTDRGKGNTYFYLFDLIPSWLNGSFWTDGSNHFHELAFVFGLPMVPGFQTSVTPEEKILSLAIINYWANFAKTGNPNIPRHPAQKAMWPEFNLPDEKYMEFSSDFSEQSVSQNLYPVRMRFWLDLLPNLLTAFSQKRSCELAPNDTNTRKEPIVETDQGIIEGYHDIKQGMEWDMFLGIPYAAPPVGPLRFNKPRAARSWEGILNATAHRPSCIQKRSDIRRYLSFNSLPVQHSMSEDCLYLNVYVPYDVTVAKMENFAVMIFIHGGSFKEGTSSFYDARALSWHGKVIAVTFNYRLGALGFLSTEESSSPGNYGLFDQQMAFQWVKSNIANFGGDPERITVFGQSAGSMSALAHALSPPSQRIIRRVIAQSGAIPAWRPPGPFPRQQARDLAEQLGCSSSFMYYIVECLRTKDPVEIMEVVLPGNGSFAFPPVFDGDFFPHDPRFSITSFNFTNIDLLIGTNDEDGILVAAGLLGARKSLNAFREGMSQKDLVDTLERGFTNVISSQGDLMAKTLLQNYLDWNDPDNRKKNIKSFVDILGDFYFTAPSIFFADHHSLAQGNTYLYRFSLNPTIRNLIYDPPQYPGKVGADHGDELPFVFGYPLLNDGPTPDATDVDKELSYDMIRYWTNFARFGDPNAMDIPTQWPKYSVDTGRKFLDIGRQIEARGDLRMDRISLWNDIISRMLEVESTAFCSISSHSRIQPIDLMSADTSLTRGASPIVHTKYGQIRGYNKRSHTKVGSGLVDVYTNIPFAKPPVGDLRFQPPEDPESWNGIRDGTVSPPACVQPLLTRTSLLRDTSDTNEDCLYLRVHSPRESNKTKDLLPVLVFIDGKDFKNADGVHLDLSNMAAYGDMVIVTLNYRLGALGFFSTGLKTKVTGNYGLLDIIAALRWINSNIAAFRGDPDRVTLGGQESGAIMAHILLFIPQSDGLFTQMFSLGGSAMQPSTADYIEGRLQNVKSFIEEINCPILPYPSMIDCLYSKPSNTFALTNTSKLTDIKFGPVIDKTVIFDDIKKLANEGKFQKMNVMFGYDEDYMTGILHRQFPRGLMTDDQLDEALDSLIAQHLPIYRGTAIVPEMITNFYYRETYNSKEVNNFETYKAIVTDFLLSVPMEMSAKLHSQSESSAFLYKRPFQNEDLGKFDNGITEYDYIPVFLGLAFSNHHNNLTYTDRDHYLSVQLMTFISNFASSGNPNIGRQVPVEWPVYNAGDPFFLRIGDRLRSEPCGEGKKVDFWVNILPSVADLASAVSKLHFLPQISPETNKSSTECSWNPVLGMDRNMTNHVIWVLLILVGVLVLVTVFLICHVLRRKQLEPVT